MTVYSGVESTYTGATIPVRQLGDHIYSTDKDEFPFLKAVGLDSMDEEIYATKFEWLTFSGIPRTDAIDESGGIDNSQTTFVVDNSEYFKEGDIILVEDELMWVSSIAFSTDTLTVSRGFAGTTAAAHNDNTVVTIVGNARLEGSSPGTHRAASFGTEYNYTQIIDLGTVEVTGTEEAIKKYGVDSLMQFRLDQRLRKGYVDMERDLIYGKRNQGSSSVARAMGGLVQYITNSTNKSGAAIAESDVITALESIWGSCGAEFKPDTMLGNSWAKRKVTSWYAGAAGTPRNYERQERVGGYYVTTVETDFGTLDFLMAHTVKSSELWLLNLDNIMMGPLRGRALKDMEASTPGDDKYRRRVLGEYTIKVTNPAAMWLIYNFSTSS